jgi:hypothetical protein
MPDKTFVEEIKQTKKMKRTFDDYLNYFILIFPFGFVYIGFSIASGYFKHNLEIQQLLISIIPISLGLLFAYFTLKRLNENITFEIIENKKNLEIDNLKTALENYFRRNDIYIDEKLGFIEVLTKLTGFSWGERITIIKDGNLYLVNSRPSGTSQPVTITKDRKNIKKIRSILTE